MDLEQTFFSGRTLSLSVLTSVFASCILRMGAETDARTMLLWGLPMALALTVISALLAAAEENSQIFEGKGAASKVCCVLLAFWLVWELGETLLQMQAICWTEFSSMAVIGLLPLLLWVGWKLEPTVLGRSASILWWMAVLAILLCILGLRGQPHWENLMESGETGTLTVPIYAEYFALPFFCPVSEIRRRVWFPVGAFALTAAFALGMGAIFGAAYSVPGTELLRAGTLGEISRLDAAVLLLWLVLALFRVCFLVQAVRKLWQRIRPPMEETA